MEKELKDQRVTIMLTPSEFQAVDDWSFANRIRSRGEAIRQLINAGLYATGTRVPIIERIGPDGRVNRPHRYTDGFFRVADPALGEAKKLADNQIKAASLEEVAQFVKNGFHLRMSDDTSDGPDLIAPQNITIK